MTSTTCSNLKEVRASQRVDRYTKASDRESCGGPGEVYGCASVVVEGGGFPVVLTSYKWQDVWFSDGSATHDAAPL